MLRDSLHFGKMFRLYWSLLRTSWKLIREIDHFLFSTKIFILMQQAPNPLAQVPDLIPPRLSQSLWERHVPLLPVRD